MKLTLNKLKLLIEEVIEEGKQERQWISQRPEEERAIWQTAEEKGMKVSDMSWVVKVKTKEEELEEIILLVLKYDRTFIVIPRNKKTLGTSFKSFKSLKLQ